VTKHEIAADGLVQEDGIVMERNGRKIIVEDRVIYALAGTTACLAPLIAWHKAGADADKLPKFGDCHWALLVIKGGQAPVVYSHQLPHPEEQRYPFAMGSGRLLARSAMLLGKTARQAVEFACANDVHSGGDILEVNIPKALGLSQPGDVPAQSYVPHPEKPGKFIVRQTKRERAA
jgi:ATP-dependent protease HslVU (ClpYQ) peptidase subunit